MSYHGPLALFSSPLSSAVAARHATAQCEQLASSASGSIIINSTSIAAGGLSIDGVNNTSPLCRVFASVPYALNSSVVYEVWLPDPPQYNGRYLSVGKNSCRLMIALAT